MSAKVFVSDLESHIPSASGNLWQMNLLAGKYSTPQAFTVPGGYIHHLSSGTAKIPWVQVRDYLSSTNCAWNTLAIIYLYFLKF